MKKEARELLKRAVRDKRNKVREENVVVIDEERDREVHVRHTQTDGEVSEPMLSEAFMGCLRLDPGCLEDEITLTNVVAMKRFQTPVLVAIAAELEGDPRLDELLDGLNIVTTKYFTQNTKTAVMDSLSRKAWEAARGEGIDELVAARLRNGKPEWLN